MYNSHQPWDPLKVCVVGKSYPPEFYDFIENPRLRELFQQIARETEEDFQELIKVLTQFGVKVIRPNAPSVQAAEFIAEGVRIPGPVSMTPRDQMIMVGKNFFLFPYDRTSIKSSGRNVPNKKWTQEFYNNVKGDDWPEFQPIENMPTWVQQEATKFLKDVASEDSLAKATSTFDWFSPIIDDVQAAGNTIISKEYADLLKYIPANGITRIGKDLYFGISDTALEHSQLKGLINDYFSDYRCHFITTGGHIDGCFCPVKPGLIVSIHGMDTYEHTFPGWEVVYLEGESWDKVTGFTDLKAKNQGKWWIKGHEHDDELIDYVETWLRDWVGYVEESVFDVNMLSIDEHNIIVSGYNEKAFDAFARHGVTPHIVKFRHRYFWDGGIHCVTLDLHRAGQRQCFFPARD